MSERCGNITFEVIFNLCADDEKEKERPASPIPKRLTGTSPPLVLMIHAIHPPSIKPYKQKKHECRICLSGSKALAGPSVQTSNSSSRHEIYNDFNPYCFFSHIIFINVLGLV